MHELSLAMSVADIAAARLGEHEGARLAGVTVEVGALAGVETETFLTALHTVFDPSVSVTLTEVEGSAQCLDCGRRFATARRFPQCPACGSAACLLTAGTSLRLTTLTLARPEP